MEGEARGMIGRLWKARKRTGLLRGVYWRLLGVHAYGQRGTATQHEITTRSQKLSIMMRR